jgi:hypothetical protein
MQGTDISVEQSDATVSENHSIIKILRDLWSAESARIFMRHPAGVNS